MFDRSMLRVPPLRLAPLAVAAACSAPTAHPITPAPARPRLVVLLVVDQLPEWTFAQKRPHLTAGFDRLLREGDWHTGIHPTPATLTAPGHALLGTGEPPYHSGILANEWWDIATQKPIHAIDDPAGGASTALLRVPGLGDSIAAAHTGAKAVAVSLKDRAALLPLGHAGTAVWFVSKNAAFVSSQPAPWLSEYNDAHPVRAQLQYVWTPLDATQLARLTGVPDDQPGEIGEKSFGPTFPHALATAKDPADAIFAVPLGNDLVFDVATAALAGEQLGADDTPDLLVLSLSAHDYVGHGWGHESWEAWDLVLRLDQRLAEFLNVLDAKVGAGRWAMIVTSDHGAAPLPERTGGGRITFESLKEAANRAAIAELGPGDWIGSVHYPYLWLSAAARAKPDADRAVVVKKIMFALRAFPSIAQVGNTADFAGHCETRTGDAAAICQMIDPERAGEVFWLPKRNWIVEDADEPLATAHGSFQDYDRQVPVIVVPPGRTSHAPLAAPTGTVAMGEIASMLAGWLGVTPPTALPRR